MLHLKVRVRVPGSEDTSARRWISLGFWLVFFLLTCYCIFGVDLSAETVDWGANDILPEYYFPAWIVALICVAVSLCVYPPQASKRSVLIVTAIALVWLALEALRVFTVPRTDTLYAMVDPIGDTGVVSITYAASLSDQLMDFSDEVLWVLFLITLFCQSRKIIGKTGVKIILWGIILLAFASCIYTYLPGQSDGYTQGVQYIAGETDTLPAITSFYREKNSFAYVLFLGIVAALILNAEKPRAILYVPIMLYFGITVFFTNCRTIEWILVVFTPIYTVWRLAVTFRVNPVRNLIAFIVVFALIIALVVLFVTRGSEEGTIFHRIIEAIEAGLDRGSTTLSTRTKIWKIAVNVVDYSPFRLLFGWGYRSGENIAMAFQGHWLNELQRSSHSGIIDIFMRYGAIGILAFIAMWCLTGHYIVRLAKHDRADLACELAIVLILFLIYSLDESKIPFYRDVSSIPFLIIGVCPALAFDDGSRYVTEIYI